VTETLPDKDITESCFQLMSPNLNYKYGLEFLRVTAGCFSGNWNYRVCTMAFFKDVFKKILGYVCKRNLFYYGPLNLNG
jgi:hypothetical protein